MAMRIVAINGSHRGERGYTHFLIGKLFEGAAEVGAECEVVTLAGLKVNRCLACEKCVVDTEKRCVLDDRDDVRSILNTMKSADRIVFATSVYLQTISGLMKTFLDRLLVTADVFQPRLTKSGLMFYETNRAICGKPLVTLITCNNVEPETTKNCVSYFRTYRRFNDARNAGVLVRNAAYLTGRGKDPEAEKRFPKILDVYRAYIRAGRELGTEGRIRFLTQYRANQEVVPMPFFRVLKHLKPVKRKFLEHAKKAIDGVRPAGAAHAETDGARRSANGREGQ
jgi:putative NADPH-quinone reductase